MKNKIWFFQSDHLLQGMNWHRHILHQLGQFRKTVSYCSIFSTVLKSTGQTLRFCSSSAISTRDTCSSGYCRTVSMRNRSPPTASCIAYGIYSVLSKTFLWFNTILGLQQHRHLMYLQFPGEKSRQSLFSESLVVVSFASAVSSSTTVSVCDTVSSEFLYFLHSRL